MVDGELATESRPGSAMLAPSRIARQIENDILLGQLRSGEWLKLVDVEQRYGASRFEIRGALARLAAQGVLEHVPHRGYRVLLVSEAELSQRVEIRLILELQTCELIARRATPADCERLLCLARRFEEAIETEPVPELDAANHRFHRELVALCGNPALERLINELRERTKPLGWQHWKTVAHSRKSAAEHVAMVEALNRADAARLQDVVCTHILRLKPGPRPGFLDAIGRTLRSRVADHH